MLSAQQLTARHHRGNLPRLLPLNGWTAFNLILDLDIEELPNETTIEQRLEEIERLRVDDQRIRWLTVCRLAEMALKIAGDYADHCDFQAAGDLLANPRQIDVFQRGLDFPVVKHRHRGLSEQFAVEIGGNDPVVWLMCETQVHIRTKALLPHFRQILATSGHVHPDYIEDLDRRMCRVADTVAFLTSWRITDRHELAARMEVQGPEGRAFVKENLCQFDNSRFREMGEDIISLIASHDAQSRFLRGIDQW